MRWYALSLTQLDQLSLTDRMVLVPKTSPSAKNRFLYHNERLNRLPSSPFSALFAMARLPLVRATLPGLFREPWAERRTTSEDESVHDFLSRRAGKPMAENMASAMIHGIYAGDSRELSIQSVMPNLVDMEQTHGSLLRAAMPFGKKLNSRYRAGLRNRWEEEKKKAARVSQRLPPALLDMVKNTSIYSFPNGLGEIIAALQDHLIAAPHVELRMDAACEKIEAGTDGVELHLANEKAPLFADRLLAALPSSKLAPLLPEIPHLGYNPSATMSVVDVVLAPPDASSMQYELPIRGFGFLVPRSASNNQDEILGVVLDSDAMPNQGTPGADGRPPFIKLTVMLGGPYWRGKQQEELPSVDEVEQRALRTLEKMLGVPPFILQTHLRLLRGRVLENTIPQYLVGHPARMQEVHDMLVHDPRWRDRLTLLGYSYAGVGVNDCVTNALDACDAIVAHEQGDASEQTASQSTGLCAAL